MHEMLEHATKFAFDGVFVPLYIGLVVVEGFATRLFKTCDVYCFGDIFAIHKTLHFFLIDTNRLLAAL